MTMDLRTLSVFWLVAMMMPALLRARLFEMRVEMDKRYGVPAHVEERTIGMTDNIFYS